MPSTHLFAEAGLACETCVRDTAALLRARGRRFILVVRNSNLVCAG
jgi:hypothetical protein